jgi:hypothetical protein
MDAPDWSTPKILASGLFEAVKLQLRLLYEKKTGDGSNAEFQKFREITHGLQHKVLMSEEELEKYITEADVTTNTPEELATPDGAQRDRIEPHR